MGGGHNHHGSHWLRLLLGPQEAVGHTWGCWARSVHTLVGRVGSFVYHNTTRAAPYLLLSLALQQPSSTALLHRNKRKRNDAPSNELSLSDPIPWKPVQLNPASCEAISTPCPQINRLVVSAKGQLPSRYPVFSHTRHTPKSCTSILPAVQEQATILFLFLFTPNGVQLLSSSREPKLFFCSPPLNAMTVATGAHSVIPLSQSTHHEKHKQTAAHARSKGIKRKRLGIS